MTDQKKALILLNSYLIIFFMLIISYLANSKILTYILVIHSFLLFIFTIVFRIKYPIKYKKRFLNFNKDK